MGTPGPHVDLGPTLVGKSDRLTSVDLLRGVVIAIMALDHVRDFFSNSFFIFDPTDMDKTTSAYFLTRWITHYCAPTFIFLAGTGAFLFGSRGKTKLDLFTFLFTRGLWLAFLELTVIQFGWGFNWNPLHHGAGVFWAIGWSMVVLSFLIFLPTWLITLFGLGMIACHNLLDGMTAEQINLGLLFGPDMAQYHVPKVFWMILHSPGETTVIPGYELTLGTAYCIIPWAGVMAAGYGFGTLLLLEKERRRLALALLGTVVIFCFILIRSQNSYGDARHWSVYSRREFTLWSFLNCTKYPPSLCYVLMTLGPGILFLSIFDGAKGPLARALITFGRVPLFFYLCHIFLIHGGAVLLDYARFGWSPQVHSGPWGVSPYDLDIPDNYGVSLPKVYVLWIACLAILYPLCHWFAGVKQRHRDWRWLSYL